MPRDISLEEFTKMFHSRAFVEDNLKKIYDSTHKALVKSENDMKELSPKVSGEYSESWKTQKKGKRTILFGNVSGHAAKVEFGTENMEPQNILGKNIKKTLIPNIEEQFKKDFG